LCRARPSERKVSLDNFFSLDFPLRMKGGGESQPTSSSTPSRGKVVRGQAMQRSRQRAAYSRSSAHPRWCGASQLQKPAASPWSAGQARQPLKAAAQGSRSRQPLKAAAQGSRSRQPLKAAAQGSRSRLPLKAAAQGSVQPTREAAPTPVVWRISASDASGQSKEPCL
jgi:hypothetical protein